MLGTYGTIDEKAQVILVWVTAPGHWECLPLMETKSHESKVRALDGSWRCDSRMPNNTSIRGVGKKLWGFKWGAA